jgi:HSP20 family protein
MYRDLVALQDRMNQYFEQAAAPRHPRTENNLFAGAWAPAVDIYETDQAIELKAELPEIDPKDVDIRIEDNVLYLKGERKFEKEVKEENFHRIERSYGLFSRSFALPHGIATDKISADYKNGVLKVTLPKREDSKPKQIQVHVNS